MWTDICMLNQYYAKYLVKFPTYTASEIVGGKAPLQTVSIRADSMSDIGELLNHGEYQPNIQP